MEPYPITHLRSITLQDSKTGCPIAAMDATALTGVRTAAKSALFAKMFFHNRVNSSSMTVHIYGSSTQAYFHMLQFASAFPSIGIRVIVQSGDAGTRLNSRLKKHSISNIDICSIPPTGEKPDVIITATSAPDPIVVRDIVRGVPLIIAVVSSSGQYSEIDPYLVVDCNRFIDSKISIEGKGEYKIPIEMGLIEHKSIRELIEVLIGGASYLFDYQNTTLFVSKGLIIEDYMFVARILGLR